MQCLFEPSIKLLIFTVRIRTTNCSVFFLMKQGHNSISDDHIHRIVCPPLNFSQRFILFLFSNQIKHKTFEHIISIREQTTIRHSLSFLHTRTLISMENNDFFYRFKMRMTSVLNINTVLYFGFLKRFLYVIKVSVSYVPCFIYALVIMSEFMTD